jgi:WD40 repeat protein
MDGTFQVWDAQTRQKLHALEQQMALGRAALVWGLAYSPDSRYLALARADGSVRVWDVPRAQPLYDFKGHTGPAWQVAFSPDSRILASGGSDRTVRLWDMTSGKPLRVFPEHPAMVKGVAFRPDGRSVLAACEDGMVKVWDRETGRPTFSFQGELRNPASAWFSPDARRLAWACMDGFLKVWDTTTGQLEIDQQTDTWQLRSVAFTRDGKRLALAVFDGTVRLLDAAGREMLRIFAHVYPPTHAVFNHDGTKIASASYDHTVRIWDATPLEPDPQAGYCVTLTGHKALVTAVAFSRNGRWLASGSWDGTVKLWEADSSGTPGGTPRYTLRGHTGNVSCVAISPDSRILASGGWDKTVKLWDLQAPAGDSLAVLRTIPCPERVMSIAFSADGRLLAIGRMSGIGLYDPVSGEKAAPFKPTVAPVPAVVFSLDSRYLVCAGASDPAIKVWDVAGEKSLIEIRRDPAPNGSVAISPDGRLIAGPASHQEGRPTAKIWEVDWEAGTYKESRSLSSHSGYVFRLAFSPDGRYFASGSWDSTIKIWDLKALAQNPKAEPATLRGHAGPIYGLTFSPDGRRLATGSGYAGHGEVKVWDASLWENLSSEKR